MKEIPRWQLCSGRRGGQSTLEQCYSSDTLRLKISLPICISLWPWQSLSEPESHLDTDAAFLTCIYEAPALSSKSCCPSHLRILTFPIKIFWVFFFFFFLPYSSKLPVDTKPGSWDNNTAHTPFWFQWTGSHLAFPAYSPPDSQDTTP